MHRRSASPRRCPTSGAWNNWLVGVANKRSLIADYRQDACALVVRGTDLKEDEQRQPGESVLRPHRS
jgi:hypothetical protein